MTTDATTRATDELTVALRHWLRERGQDPQVVAGALAYELAAVIAHHCPHFRASDLLVETFALTMKDQIRRLGVGVEHP